MNKDEKAPELSTPPPDLANVAVTEITSDMVPNAHASGDGSLKRSEEEIKKDANGQDSITNKIPY